MSKAATKGKGKTLGLKVDSIKNLSDAEAADVRGGTGTSVIRPTAVDAGGIRATGTSVIMPVGNIGAVKP